METKKQVENITLSYSGILHVVGKEDYISFILHDLAMYNPCINMLTLCSESCAFGKLYFAKQTI